MNPGISEPADGRPGGGEGPRRISTAQELLGLGRNLRGDYTLACDIDLGGAEWVPVGTVGQPFRGSLDGNGHTISNFRISVCGREGNAGFFGVNEGVISQLCLSGVTIRVTAEDGACVGGIAAQNGGDISGIRVRQGVLTVECTGGTVHIGALAGLNQGIIRNVEAQLDMAAAVRAGTAYIGGLTGAAERGWLETAEFGGRMELSGEESGLRAGLFAGRLCRTGLVACRFSSPMNTINGRLFRDFCAEEGPGVRYDGCLWRDNANSDELLDAACFELRSRCERHMRAMGTVQWMPSRRLAYRCSCGSRVHGQSFEPGRRYSGMPYTHKHGSLERFLACFREDGSLEPWLREEGYDGFDMYMGNDCSGAVYWAWSRVSDRVDFRWTGEMLPAAGLGTLPVGEYQTTPGSQTDELFSVNDWKTMAEAYARLHMGDAIVNKLKTGGHTRLCAAAPVVYRDRNGAIDTRASYMVTHEQGDGLYPEHRDIDSSWLIDWKYYFTKLLKDTYIPVTIQALADGVSPMPEVVLERRGEALHEGVVRSNYRIIRVTARVTDGEGRTVWMHTLYTAVNTWTEQTNDANPRETVRAVELAKFAPYWRADALLPGQTYTCALSVLLSTGSELPAGQIQFVHEQAKEEMS